MKRKEKNVDHKTIQGFGYEWEKFDQSVLSEKEHEELFEAYFSIFPWNSLSKKSTGFDLGCGSGRWAKLVAPKVGSLHCIDPSSALDVARKNLSNFDNCLFYSATVDEIPLEHSSMDFGYSLGVLHHIPDPQAGLNECVKRLKPGAPFLVYLYYAFDNRSIWFRMIWIFSDIFRKIISNLPNGLRYYSSQILALLVYFPLARIARGLEKLGLDVSSFPLSSYKNRSFYTMRTDALDRFGTKLEHRFTRLQIEKMMKKSGLEQITFSEKSAFWTAVGIRQINSSGG
ncbi:class I SAM-dependent methyltransferase [Alphaproteobacteria bacterium]|nr:class I SAM-dependent methyltransferase [Alphaproteobacteria bacterium]